MRIKEQKSATGKMFVISSQQASDKVDNKHTEALKEEYCQTSQKAKE